MIPLFVRKSWVFPIIHFTSISPLSEMVFDENEIYKAFHVRFGWQLQDQFLANYYKKV